MDKQFVETVITEERLSKLKNDIGEEINTYNDYQILELEKLMNYFKRLQQNYHDSSFLFLDHCKTCFDKCNKYEEVKEDLKHKRSLITEAEISKHKE